MTLGPGIDFGQKIRVEADADQGADSRAGPAAQVFVIST